MLSRPELITVTGLFDIDWGRELEFVEKCGGRSYQSLEEVVSDDRVEIVAVPFAIRVTALSRKTWIARA